MITFAMILKICNVVAVAGAVTGAVIAMFIPNTTNEKEKKEYWKLSLSVMIPSILLFIVVSLLKLII